ncbi:MAG: wax ester/triacylglycerol synthase domain-containing protein, partial [Candidatus Binataceae bacterium]
MAADDSATRLKRRLTALDSTFLYGETSNSPLHIGSFWFFEGHLPFDKLFEFVAKRIHLLPRYRQRLAQVPLNFAHPTLEDDPDFDLGSHVKRYQLPEGLNEEELVSEVLKNYQAPMDRARPLWEVMWFDGWPGGRTLVVSKVHHALVDGVSGVELTKVLLDFQPDAPDPAPPVDEWKPAPMPSPIERFIAATRDVFVGQMNTVAQAGSDLVRDPRAVAERARQIADAIRKLGEFANKRVVATPWNSGPVTEARSLAWLRNSFTDYRAIRNALGGTINDIVLTVLTEGAARYLDHHGYATDAWFRVGCPVNVRRPEEQTDLGNRVSMMFPTLPAAPMNAVERLKVVREETERIKAEELPQSLERLSSLIEFTPAGLMAFMSRAGTLGLDVGATLVKVSGWKPQPGRQLLPPPLMNFIATNVPGVQVPQYLAGYRCVDQIGLIPLAANVGYSVAILSYNQNL